MGDTDGEGAGCLNQAWMTEEILEFGERVVAGIHELAPLSNECAQG